MSVVLESVAEAEPAEPAEAEPAEPAEEHVRQNALNAPSEMEADESASVAESPPGPEAAEPAQATPVPKKRGRPRKEEGATPKAPVRMKAAPKPRAKKAAAAPVAPPPTESEEDDEPFSRADLETEILEFLVQRKTQQQDRRRQLWAQLAGL